MQMIKAGGPSLLWMLCIRLYFFFPLVISASCPPVFCEAAALRKGGSVFIMYALVGCIDSSFLAENNTLSLEEAVNIYLWGSSGREPFVFPFALVFFLPHNVSLPQTPWQTCSCWDCHDSPVTRPNIKAVFCDALNRANYSPYDNGVVQQLKTRIETLPTNSDYWNALPAKHFQGVHDAFMTVCTPHGRVRKWGRFCWVNVGVCYNTVCTVQRGRSRKAQALFLKA